MNAVFQLINQKAGFTVIWNKREKESIICKKKLLIKCIIRETKSVREAILGVKTKGLGKEKTITTKEPL